MSNQGLGDHARSVIDSNRYMALGTAGEAGHPWVSPVWFASEDYCNFYWVSSPDSKHSRNIAARPEVALAVFDSSVPVGGAQAVYMKGQASELTGDALEAVEGERAPAPVEAFFLYVEHVVFFRHRLTPYCGRHQPWRCAKVPTVPLWDLHSRELIPRKAKQRLAHICTSRCQSCFARDQRRRPSLEMMVS